MVRDPAPAAAPDPSRAAADVLVHFEHVRKSYDGVNFVVEDLNLSVRRGEFLTMLGPSGSGKTTTLMMLGGFERPTLGHIVLDGRPVEKLPPEKRNIGFVFQNYALFPHMTVAENVAFPLRYRGITGTAAGRKVAAALEMVHLSDFGARKPAQLSGGQQQRVALARALVFEPSLVLMDEPLGALDKQLRERMQVEIKQLQTALGITMVYVTHDQSEALTMSDRIAVFSEGRVQQLADPRTLYDAPENRFVAGFIGENNLIACTTAGLESGFAVLQSLDGTVLRAPASAPFAAGAAAWLSVRPERIRLARPGDEQANRLRGPVSELFFLGDHVRAGIAGPGGTTVVTRLAPGEGAALSLGMSITVAFDPADSRILVT
jgi:putative spermidine/putrescine transport system ATP-binding protein